MEMTAIATDNQPSNGFSNGIIVPLETATTELDTTNHILAADAINAMAMSAIFRKRFLSSPRRRRDNAHVLSKDEGVGVTFIKSCHNYNLFIKSGNSNDTITTFAAYLCGFIIIVHIIILRL